MDSRGLEIEASNSSLDQILRQVAPDNRPLQPKISYRRKVEIAEPHSTYR